MFREDRAPSSVFPAQAGIQYPENGSCLRGGDNGERWVPPARRRRYAFLNRPNLLAPPGEKHAYASVSIAPGVETRWAEVALSEEVLACVGIGAEGLQRSMESGFDGARRDAQSLGDLVETHVVDEPHEDHFPLVVG